MRQYADSWNAILSEGAGIAVNPAMVETIAAVERATAALPIGEGASAQDIGKIVDALERLVRIDQGEAEQLRFRQYDI